MMNTKRNRGGRMNPSGRNDKRSMYQQDRSQRQRPPVDKNVYIEGVYKNQRFTHVVFSLVGSVVQVQVKNGIIYEGVLKTFSQKGDTVLEVAHMVEDNNMNGGNNSVSSVPSRDRIMEKLIIKASDLVTINAANVELDYAVKGDSFTDTGISKFNGEIKERDMKELQPWDSEGGAEISLDAADNKTNGWDVNDMFKTNAMQFNVKSSYDESLAQYTTPLEKGNSIEFRRREEKAKMLAAEIEGSEQYRKHIALENGEGDNEEALFSSVVRPGEMSQSQTSQGGPGKYIPPNKRNAGASGMSRPNRGNYPQHQQQQQQQHPQHSSQGQSVNRSLSNQSNHQQSPPVINTNVQSPLEVASVNGEVSGRSSIPVSTAGPTVKTSPVHDQAPSMPVEGKHEHNPGKKSKGRVEQIKALKEFSSNFKLDDNKDIKDKDKEKDSKNAVVDCKEKDNISDELGTSSETVDEETQSKTDKPAIAEEKPHESQEVSQQEKSEVSKSTTNVPALKSVLNPNAKEFVLNPNAKSFQPKQSTQQIPTPPRPQTQSPIVQQPPAMGTILPQPVYPSPGQQFIMPPNMILSNNQPQSQAMYRPKRAVVSVKPDYPASAVQAVSGQPLITQSAQSSYMYMMTPQPTGFQMGQMMPMPPTAQSAQRFITPTSMQGMPPTTVQGAPHNQNNSADPQSGQIYIGNHQQPGPMPAHMTHANHPLNHPNHISHLNMSNLNTQQNTSQINPPPPSGAAHHHPAPSPVHTQNPNQQPMNPGQHPPSSGTPQPPQAFSQANLQPHPPLQPSPHNHNPTSPQNMQPMPYPYTSHGHPLQMQSSVGGQQFSVPNQQSSVPTSVTYSMQTHSHHSPHMQPQIVMMPQHHASGQLNHPHIHGSHQFQGHPMAGPGSMQPQIMSQSGVQGMPGQSHGQGPHPPHQMQHFLPQVHNHGGQQQPVQNYQPSQ